MDQDEGRTPAAAKSKRRLSTEIQDSSHQLLTRLKSEWAMRSFGAVIDQLVAQLYRHDGDSAEAPESLGSRPHANQPETRTADPPAHDAAISLSEAVSRLQSDQGPSDHDGAPSAAITTSGGEPDPESFFHETGALVLVNKAGKLEASLEWSEEERSRPKVKQRASGIDLPGFVRRNSAQLRRSLNPPAQDEAHRGDVLPTIAEPELTRALETASNHWFSLYGQAANEAVLEASMAWLAHDIWTQSDQCEGEAFTWTLAQHLISRCAPTWPVGPPTLERVIVLAGLLEDPFSASTLSLRIPTLIRRFVHRFRRRRQGASFQTLEHTMTLHGALKLLQIPIDTGQRLTLTQIRDAYREMAMNHHPDAGGSEDMMRRLNEAYQLIKELYRQKEA